MMERWQMAFRADGARGLGALPRTVPRTVLGAVPRAMLGLALMAGPAMVHAQAINPDVLRQVQGQLGAGQAPDRIDESRREDGQAQGFATGGLAQGRIDTREEQTLRRAEAEAQLARLYRPSAVERDYQQRLSEPRLRQFGYELFASTSAASGAVTGAVGDDYVLGVGDELVVQFQGATSDSRTVRVNREGSLVVASLPPIRAAGRPLGAVRRDLAAATSRTLLGTDVFVSLGTVRSASVFVGGEVERPGQYNLTALSDVAVALAQAGGVRRAGSLRRVRVLRGSGGTIEVDLYGLLGIGAPPSVRLQDGDRVIVPVLGPTVAIAGNVTRPGIYELRGTASVGALIDYAGGAVRPRGNQVAISRIGTDGGEQFIRAATMTTGLLAGDAVQLLAGSAGGASGRVLLRGHVDNPGARAIALVPTVRDLLGGIDDLKRDTYLPLAMLVRRDAETAARRFVPVNLGEALDGRQPVALQSEDRLFLFSRSDVEFINRTAVRRVVLGQPNLLVGCRSLDRLETLVRDSQTSRFNVVTRSAFLVERDGQTDLAATGGRLNVATRSTEAGLRSGDALAGAGAGQVQAVEQGPQLGGFDERSDTALRARREASAEQCPLVFEEEPDLLPLLIENAVAVGGAVRRPGAYPVAGSASAAVLASVAEGVLSGASDLSLDVSRGAGGTVVSEQVLLAERPGVLEQTMLGAGDDLRFNAAQPQFEAGAVLLAGEFNRPGLYSIRKGETLSQLTERAGGLSPYAYPYGAIFTRRSVKELEQEGLRRTSRELTTGLLSLAARQRDSTGGGVVAGQQLIQQLASVESVGRVVVEADPRVLALRSDLDTVLESGDAIVMPKRPSFVLALGDVANPGALQFVAGKTADAYLREVGGTISTADKGRIFIVLPDGTAQPLRGRGWGRGYEGVVPPGSTIIVPKNIDPLYRLELARDITGIIGGLLTSVATVALLATR